MKQKLSNEFWLIALILLIAAAMRLVGLGYSYSNDELSALSRLGFDDLGTLIQQGIRIDGHPAFTQVFLFYWTKLTGFESEFLVRLPFAFAGILSVWFAYKIAKLWFGKQTAFASATAIATLQFFLLYSQVARPYSFGLLFTMAAVYFWTRIIQGDQRIKNVLLGGLAAALAMYTHYFSFLQVVIVAVTGLVMTNKRTLKNYLLAMLLALLLWLPHLSVTLHQLSLGGVGQWLAPPDNGFFTSFIHYVFNNSIWLILFIIALIASSHFFSQLKFNFSKWQLVALTFVVLPFAIGFSYSILVNPVLQYSTLLFSAPFLIMFLFSFLGEVEDRKASAIMVFVLLIATGVHSISGAKYYRTEHFGVFREIADKLIAWNDDHPENVLHFGHFNSPFYIHHYLDQSGFRDSLISYDLDNPGELEKLYQITSSRQASHAALYWSTHAMPMEAFEIVRLNYPEMTEEATHFNSGAYLFKSAGEDERKALFSANLITQPETIAGNFHSSKMRADSSGLSYVLSEKDDYSLNLSKKINELTNKKPALVSSRVVFEGGDQTDMTLVLELKRENGADDWYGRDFSPAFRTSDGLNQIILSRELPFGIEENDELVVYLWKRSSTEVSIKSFEIKLYGSAPAAQRSLP